ncbi:MAG: hypothetical protein MUF51_01490, partial [Vicinamibacteria bacterium]|nr:hypothetical protein [Vicinamibacteria bacterium]
GPRKVEGDGRAPAGVFVLLAAMGYDPAPRVKINLPYRHLTADLYCVDDPASRHYNQIVNGETVVRDWKSAEPMRRPDNLYRLLIVVGHNVDPIEPGQGSCLFIHLRRNPPAPTAGCTALEDAALRELLLWLRSDQRPVLVQLPRVVSQQLARGWGLPRP